MGRAFRYAFTFSPRYLVYALSQLQLVGDSIASQREPLVSVRVDVEPPALIASLDWCSVVSVRCTGECAEMSHPLCEACLRLLRLVGKPNLSGGKPDVPVLRR